MPLLLFAAILLIAGLAFNLAYLDTGGDQFPTAPGSGSPNPNPLGILDPQTASILLIASFVGVGAAIILAIWIRRRQGIPVQRVLRPTTWADMVALVIAFAIFGAFVFLWPRLVGGSGQAQPGSSSNATGGSNITVVPGVAGIPLGVFLAVALFVSIIIISFMLHLGSRFRGAVGPPRPRSSRGAAAHAVRAAIAELETGGDVREVILACYARFCMFLGTRGISEQEPLTPRELEDLAVRRLSVSSDSAEALTALFEEARYSEHRLGEPDRDRALRSLERIRADLEA